MAASIHDSSERWAKPGVLGLTFGLVALLLQDHQRKLVLCHGLSSIICKGQREVSMSPKFLSSHHPEPCILEYNRGKGTRKPLESSGSFLISRYISVGQFCSACSLNTFTAPFISHSFIRLSIRQAVSVVLLASENKLIN